ncbi:MAG: hypothetical protein H7Y15_00855 [Pseudonocardia sp.]|nr:hypothetical protein [Pseudonocardia sp.]
MSAPSNDSEFEEAALDLALTDPGEYLRCYGDEPGFTDRESRIAALRRERAEAEAHEINDVMIEKREG